jgi:hypothetical protein
VWLSVVAVWESVLGNSRSASRRADSSCANAWKFALAESTRRASWSSFYPSSVDSAENEWIARLMLVRR